MYEMSNLAAEPGQDFSSPPGSNSLSPDRPASLGVSGLASADIHISFSYAIFFHQKGVTTVLSVSFYVVYILWVIYIHGFSHIKELPVS